MDNSTIHKKYLDQGTAGYAVIRKFYSRYADVLARASIVHVNDVVHEVFVSLSKIDFAQVHNVDHYVIRAVKLQCWSILDKAIRFKVLVPVDGEAADYDDAAGRGRKDIHVPGSVDHLLELEGMELLASMNLFKVRVGVAEAQLLNLLIDGTPRSEIAAVLGLNMNTVDTKIRRLRVRLADFLRDLGYSYKILEKFE